MKNLSLFAGVFLLVFWLQSCSVYHSDSTTLKQAIQSKNQVRVVTLDNVFYEFKKLEREDGQLYGITGKKTETAAQLADHKQFVKGKFIRIALSDEEVQAVYLKNKSISRLVNYGVPVVGAAGLLTVTSENFKPDVGN
ncbi:MAG: hypothetical protein WBL21_11490 [Salinimicrobium sp.]